MKTFHAEKNGVNLGSGDAARNSVFRIYRIGAEDRGLAFNLTLEQFSTITSKNCFYCDTPPANSYKRSNSNSGEFIYSGIDRVDNSVGYEINNCVPCCYPCNNRKRSVTKEIIEKAYHFLCAQKLDKPYV